MEDSTVGVKGLVDSGITTIPSSYIHPHATLATINAGPTVAIPVIDLAGVDAEGRSSIVEKVSRAARELGFFQVVNHGVPAAVMEGVIGGIRRFHEQSGEVKKKLYREDIGSGVAFYSHIGSRAANWRDTLQVRLSPDPETDEIPEICRKEIFEWDKEAKRVGETLMEVLCEGVGVEKEGLKKMKCSESRMMVGHYSPPCPQPNLTFGVASHKDPVIITVLLQDHIGGLQFKYGDGWIDVKPLPGALLINVGDLLQLISNGEYKSETHRVLANPSKEARISIAVFFNSTDHDSVFGPFPELIAEKGAIFGQFRLPDIMGKIYEADLAGKSLTEYFKL